MEDWLVLPWKVSLCNWFSWFALCFREVTYAKPQFAKGISWISFVEWKTKETFVLLIDEVSEAWHLPLVWLFIWLRLFLTIALLAQAIKALTWSYVSLLCLDTGSIPGRSTFFFFAHFFSAKNIYLKKTVLSKLLKENV